MNRKEFRAEMIRYGDTGETLAKALGISPTSLSYKMNGKMNGFTQKEMQTIIDRYKLTPDDVARIFFTPCAS